MAPVDNATALPLSPYYRRIPQFVIEDRDLPPLARYLFVVIAQAVNLNSNDVQMTIEELADKAGISARQVIRLGKKLEDKGYVRVERAARGSKIPNVYHLAGEAARIVLGRSFEKQVSEGQPTYKEQVPVRQSPAAEECPSDTRLSDSQTPVSAGRVTHRPITKQEGQRNVEDRNKKDVVVIDTFSPIFKLDGLEPQDMQALIDQYGVSRMRDVLNGMDKQRKHIENKVGWVKAALRDNWQFGYKRKEEAVEPKRDKYYDFFEH